MQSSLSNHWQFAAARSFFALEELTYRFDFSKEAASANCVGITPQWLVEIIDGFLGENDDVVLPGNRRTLLQCRELLSSQIQAVFDKGLAAGQAAYERLPNLRDSWDAEVIRDLASKAAPNEGMLRGWFMEAFCYAWTSSEIEYVKKQHGG